MTSAIAASIAAHSPCNVAYPNIWDPVLGAARAPKVLVWHDIVETTTEMDLDGQGFDVTLGGHYKDYVGTDFSAFDVVFWPQGDSANYTFALQAGVDAALAAFVQGGGALVRCGWGLWFETAQAYQELPYINPLCFALMPLNGDSQLGYQDSGTGPWTATSGPSFLKYGLPDVIPLPDTSGGLMFSTLKPGAIMAYTAFEPTQAPLVPAVCYTTQDGGCATYINDTLYYNRSPAGPLPTTIKQVFYNAIRFAAQKAANP